MLPNRRHDPWLSLSLSLSRRDCRYRLAGVVGYLLSFGVGLSSGPWVVNAEIYPTRLRGIGNAGACTMNWIANYAVSATFLTACKALGEFPWNILRVVEQVKGCA